MSYKFVQKQLELQDVLVYLGLGRPSARGFVAAVLTAGVLYVGGLPHAAFDDDGRIRPFRPIAPGPDSVTLEHFLVIPLSVGAAVALFT